jgi:hypothetical protein
LCNEEFKTSTKHNDIKNAIKKYQFINDD